VKEKIKIIACSQETFWYSDKIGQTYFIVKRVGSDYLVSVGGSSGCAFFVRGCDAEILKVVTPA
jgi:hypothetical protein